MAGLTAAYELKQAGHDVVLLEADTRAGGRVRTLRAPFSEGLYAESGATLLPSNHTQVVDYAKHFGLSMRPIPSHSFNRSYVMDGTPVAVEDAARHVDGLTAEEREMGLAGMRVEYLMPLITDLPEVSEVDWPTPDVLPYDASTFGDLIREQGASDAAVEMLRMGYYDVWGDGVEDASALYLLKQNRLLAARDLYTVDGGSDRLTDAMASALSPELRYGAAVRRIEQDSDAVRAVYGKPGREHVVRGDRLVCTVPFSVLRTMEIDPPLDGLQKDAIDTLPYTDVVRVYVQVRRDENHPSPGIWSPTNGPMEVLREAVYSRTDTRTIYSAFMSGEQARRMAEYASGERVDWLVEQIEGIAPGFHAAVEGGASVAWSEEPWARGAYAWYRPGQVERYSGGLATPHGRVHFAGEHTSSYEGWLLGAIVSGLRAAKEVHTSV